VPRPRDRRALIGVSRARSGAMGLRTGDGLRAYYQGKIEAAEVAIRDRQNDLGRMEAQRNELNTKGAPLRGRRRCHERARGHGLRTETRRARRRAPRRARPPALNRRRRRLSALGSLPTCLSKP
jgi:hypothetical protein